LPKKKIRILVVDDSTFMRKILKEMIESDPECKVIRTAGDGVEALKAVERYKPDVITMDIDLPEIDGLTCIAYIMEEYPTPVVVVTGYSEFLGEETIKALEYGAVDFMRKNCKSPSLNLLEMKEELMSKIKLASRVDVRKLQPVSLKDTRKEVKKPAPKTTNKIVVIAASSGGPRALGQLIPKLPADLPAGILVVQHIPAEFVSPLVTRLNWESALEVKVAEHGETIQQGKVLFSPTDVYCEIESKGRKKESIKFVPILKRKEHLFHSANILMISLAAHFGVSSTGVVLTGMGNDGTEGLRAIKKYGGTTIAEHESTCIVNGMPRSAIQAGVVDKIVPLPKIAEEIVKAVKS